MHDHQELHEPQIHPDPRKHLSLDCCGVRSSVRKLAKRTLPSLNRRSDMVDLVPERGDEVKDWVALL